MLHWSRRECPSGKYLFFDDFKCKAAVKLHARSAEQRAHSLGGSALAADDLTQILGVDSEFDNRCARALDRGDFDFFRMIHEGPSDGFDKLFHQAPPSLIDERVNRGKSARSNR